MNLFNALEIVLVFTKNKKKWNKLCVENLGVYTTETFFLLVFKHSVIAYFALAHALVNANLD